MKKDKRFKYQIGEVFRWYEGAPDLLFYIREMDVGAGYLLCSLSSNYVYDRVNLGTLEYNFRQVKSEWVKRKAQIKLKEEEKDSIMYPWFP